jgi:cytochrome c-type biogenesis protein CcmH/NrfF
MWGLVAGTVSYPVFAWYSRRYLDEQGLERGFTRMVLVFLVATLLSSALGYGVSWMTSTPQSRSSQAQLQKKGTAMLANELKCAQDPASAVCQSTAEQADALEKKLLSGLTGNHKNQ